MHKYHHQCVEEFDPQNEASYLGSPPPQTVQIGHGSTKDSMLSNSYGKSAASDSEIATLSLKRAFPVIVICLLLVWWRAKLLFTPLPPYDFMTYWAGGRLFLSGSNPYSASAMYAIERSLGWSYTQPLVMLNPPWALPFAVLLGVLPFQIAHYLWLVVSLILEAISSIALWRYFGGQKRKQWIALVLLATFLPAGSAEYMGQATPLMLAGLTAFLYLLRHQRYLLAGACLLTLGLKPHLLYLVFLAILLWALQTRKWSLLMSSILAYASTTIATIIYNRNVLGYFHGAVHAAMDTSCGVGGVLRSIFGMQHAWLQVLPTAIGTAWFAHYWIRNRRGWTWEERLPLVLLVSLSTTPYFWAHDFVLAIPALVALAVAISETRTDWLVASAFYFLAQKAIFSEAELMSTAWMATASLLWLVLYQVGTSGLARTEGITIDPRQRLSLFTHP